MTTTIASDSRDMQAAEAALQSLQSKTVEALSQSVLTRPFVTQQMQRYLQRLRLDLSPLSIVHVAGTKGKGSTCAFTESILRHCGLTTGLYTSPHLIHVNERFKLNGRTVSDDTFLRHFWAVWDALHATAAEAGDDPVMPSFFRFLTLVGFHLFCEERPDVLVLEVGMGGRLDSTNVVAAPTVCGITAIGFDHMEVLGHTLTQIAREKGGILKPGVPAFTIPQPPEVLATLQQCAAEEGTELTVLPRLPPTLELGLDGDHQLENATLAVTLARVVLEAQARAGRVGGEVARAWPAGEGAQLPAEVVEGLKATTWAGRCQRFTDREAQNVRYLVDGAHTDASMRVACAWFRQQMHRDQHAAVHTPPSTAADEDDELALSALPEASSAYLVLLFNAGHVRDPFDLLQPVVEMGLSDPAYRFGHFLACPFDHDRPHLQKPPAFEQLLAQQPLPLQQFAATQWVPASPSPAPTWQHTLFRVFDLLQAFQRARSGGGATMAPYTPRFVWQSSSGVAVSSVRRMAAWHPKLQFRVLVCGSLYLVGNVLDKLGYRIP